MQFLKPKGGKKQSKQYVNDNPIESLRSIGSGVASSVKEDLGREMVKDLWNQMLGSEKPNRRGGDLSEGQDLILNQKNEAPKHADLEPAINYRREILGREKRVLTENAQEIRVKIEEVMIEIRRLIESSQELQVEFAEVAVEEVVEKPGKYHLNFLEWLLSTIRDTRQKVEYGGAWLEAFYSKKSKRKYWNMFKKHGTSFGLSNERSVSTQTG
ncbi:MAG: hypothetical protein HYV38_03445 [Candidatus Levybacteria bacterium]|nr:hypothetical protein [Candidatus Levybacteria bacterium]MBI2421112.1 hypothetical protein [Candidatus Levybacteria bacterium]MBI4097588.1 hypothetical protein [Candidatus Levybacteria bacterium]